MIEAILYVLWFLLIVALVFLAVCTLLLLSMIVGVVVSLMRKRHSTRLIAPNLRSDAEDEELPFSDFEEAE